MNQEFKDSPYTMNGEIPILEWFLYRRSNTEGKKYRR